MIKFRYTINEANKIPHYPWYQVAYYYWTCEPGPKSVCYPWGIHIIAMLIRRAFLGINRITKRYCLSWYDRELFKATTKIRALEDNLKDMTCLAYYNTLLIKAQLDDLGVLDMSDINNHYL